MKRKIVTMMLVSMMALGTVGCGESAAEPDTKQESVEKEETDAGEAKEEATEETEEASEEEKEEATEDDTAEDDGIIDFTTDTFNVKYVKHEFGKDFEGNKCLYYYYTFTNNGEENATAGIVANVQCFQDGSECEMAITDDTNDSMNNYAMNEVQPGGTVEVCQTFKLKSDTELTIEASELISFDNVKDTQKITVE